MFNNAKIFRQLSTSQIRNILRDGTYARLQFFEGKLKSEKESRRCAIQDLNLNQLNLKFNQGTTARYAEIGILFSAKTNGKQAKEITPKPKMLLNMFIFYPKPFS